MTDPIRGLPDGAKHVIDAAMVSVTAGALIKLLPAIAAVLSIIWTVIRIYETKTVQGWLGRVANDD